MSNKTKFNGWLASTGRVKCLSTADRYARAIDRVSEFLSNELGENIELYHPLMRPHMRNISLALSSRGEFADFGAERGGLYRAAFKAFCEFIEAEGV